MTNTYTQPNYEGAENLKRAIDRDDVEALRSLIIGAALYEEDFDFVQGACVRLSDHPDDIVRGNAVLGFGHLARLFGQLGDEALAIIRKSRRDPSDYVRGHAHSAASDASHFLDIKLLDESEGELPSS